MTSAAAAEASARDRGPFRYTVLDNEEAVGEAMFDELVRYADETPGDIVLVLLGGRGAGLCTGLSAARPKPASWTTC